MPVLISGGEVIFVVQFLKFLFNFRLSLEAADIGHIDYLGMFTSLRVHKMQSS